MKSFVYLITDDVGIHARPAGELVKIAKQFKSKITVSANGKKAEATKLMALMGLGVRQGMQVQVDIEGEDDEAAFKTLQDFFEENL